MMRPLIFSAALVMASAMDYSQYDMQNNVNASLCKFASYLDGTVLLPQNKCCNGELKALNYTCVGDVNDGLTFASTAAKALADCTTRKVPASFFIMRSTADVAKTVKFLTHFNLKFTTRSGGHSQSCASTCNGCAVVSLSLMKDQQRLTPSKCSDVFLVAQAGVTLSDAFFSYANTSHMILHGVMPTVSLGGHYQGGGMGYFTRLFGFGSDYVVGVEIVLATGEIVTVFSDEYELLLRGYRTNNKHSRLLWALKGSGHAGFGIITKYWIKMIAKPKWVVTGKAEYDIVSVDTMRNFWKATCGYFGHPTNEATESKRLLVWPRLLPIVDYAAGKAPKLHFLYWYTAESDDQATALAEGTAEIEKYLSQIVDEPSSKTLYVTESQNIQESIITPPAVSGAGTCASKNVLDKRDICENEAWLDETAERLYNMSKLSDWLYKGQYFYYVFEQWGGQASWNDEHFLTTSMSSRNSWGTLNYCRWPLSAAVPRQSLYNQIREFNTNMFLPISDVYYGNYVDYMVEDIRQIYPVASIYHRVKALKKKYDPTNIFNSDGSTPYLF